MSVNVPAQLPEPRRRSSRGGPELSTISLDVEVVTAILDRRAAEGQGTRAELMCRGTGRAGRRRAL